MDKISDKELLNDLKKADNKHNEPHTQKKHQKYGEYSPSTLTHRFNGWNQAKKEAGLEKLSGKQDIYTEEQILRQIKQLNEEKNGFLTLKDIRENTDFSYNTMSRKVGGIQEVKQRLDIKDKEDQFEKWVETLKEIGHGSVTLDELRDKLDNYVLHHLTIKDFKEWNKNQDNDLTVSDTKNNSNKGKKQVFIDIGKGNFKDKLLRRYNDDIPEEHEELFLHYVSQGFSPTSILGTIQYLDNDITQEENDYCSTTTVRDMRKRFKQDGFLDNFSGD